MKNKKGTVLIRIGLLFLMAAFVLTSYNIWEAYNAKITSDRAVAEMTNNLKMQEAVQSEESEETIGEIPLHIAFPDKEMPTIMIDGYRYVGILDIPEKGLSLAVLDGEWNYEKLKRAPCRFAGSIYRDNMVIAGHNYSSHFSKIKSLQPGSQIRFTDVAGNVFYYEVGWLETLKPEQVETLEQAKGWELSLFTCTYGGGERCVVRCNRQK